MGCAVWRQLRQERALRMLEKLRERIFERIEQAKSQTHQQWRLKS